MIKGRADSMATIKDIKVPGGTAGERRTDDSGGESVRNFIIITVLAVIAGVASVALGNPVATNLITGAAVVAAAVFSVSAEKLYYDAEVNSIMWNDGDLAVEQAQYLQYYVDFPY